jgi:hypothetical protein
VHGTSRQRDGTAIGHKSKLTGRGEILIRASHFTERAPMLARSGWQIVNRPSEQCHTPNGHPLARYHDSDWPSMLNVQGFPVLLPRQYNRSIILPVNALDVRS